MTKLQTGENSIRFKVNGKAFEVKCDDATADDRLVDFLRRSALLTGTKTMCREGGCGACVVSVTSKNPGYSETEARALNSCLLPVLQCDGLEIITVEGLGNKKDGYHPLQKQLADLNGSQCGYCSPGMVMSAYSLLSSKGKAATMKDVEQSLDGNICRCTGYRPILDAFKTFASDATPELKSLCPDVEDIGSVVKKCPRSGSPCSGHCHSRTEANGHCNGTAGSGAEIRSGNWFRPSDMQSLLEFIGGSDSYRLVAGNTGVGVYKNDGPFDTFVDISRIPELHAFSIDSPLTVGGSLTLTQLLEVFQEASRTNPDYWYTSVLAEHVGKIGSVPLRNAGTIAGNLMLKHAHNDFPSDLFIIMETAGASINILDSKGTSTSLSLSEFLKTPMQGKVISSLILPPLDKQGTTVRTFKVMPRCHNAHAYINAGFRAKVNSEFVVTEKPTIIYGGIDSTFIHAEKTEEFLVGKSLADETTLQGALQLLEQEINPVPDAPNPDPQYRISVAQSLFYKFALSAIGDLADASVKSGSTVLERGVSSGKQYFDTGNEEAKPLHQPVPKVEARAQCSGEAEFIDDIPLLPNELHAYFVLSTVANCKLVSVDASEALKSEGVVAFFDAKNNPATSNIIIEPVFDATEVEELFASERVLYSGQPLGVIIARTQQQARDAARLVRVEYADHQKPVLTIKEALNHPDRIIPHANFGPPDMFQYGDFQAAYSSSAMIIEGEFETGNQYHFHMETQITRCVPTEDGMRVFSASQDIDGLQKTIARLLGLKKNQIEMEVRRLGGAYGGKFSRAAHVAAVCAVVSSALRQPVRMQLDLQTNMEFAGGRLPNYCKYKVGVSAEGLLQAVEMDLITDCGANFNEGTAFFAATFVQNCYEAAAWKVNPKLAKTDTPRNTYCRAPGTTEAIAIMENLMEHVASARGEDPLVFRLKNLRKSGVNFCGKPAEPEAIQSIVNQLIESSAYESRKEAAEKFNNENRWKKRGINLLPMLYTVDYHPFRYNCLVAVYHDDGSVAVTHGGVECGQGINTKVAQVVAMELGIPIEMVSIKPTNVLTNANGSVTGGSLTSELNCYAAMSACRVLKERMQPIREKLGNPDWKTLVEACYNSDVDLTARHYYTPKDDVKGYSIHGAVVTEVELDVLTGEKIIRRVDLIEDAGLSMNPSVDIGQVEGAFVMGLGLWTSEKISYDPETGRKLTNCTWNYKPPANKDIPEEFHVTMLKNASNPNGVLRSKATGEPPLCMSVSVLFALRNAVDSARKDSGLTGWFPLDGPATIDVLQKNAATKAEEFKYRLEK